MEYPFSHMIVIINTECYTMYSRGEYCTEQILYIALACEGNVYSFRDTIHR